MLNRFLVEFRLLAVTIKQVELNTDQEVVLHSTPHEGWRGIVAGKGRWGMVEARPVMVSGRVSEAICTVTNNVGSCSFKKTSARSGF